MFTRYRQASRKIFEILSSHCSIVEKASIDEAYLDLTAEVHKRLQQNIENDNYLQSELFPGSFVVGSYALKNDDSN